MKVQLTHRGWFGVCPVYFGLVDTDAPLVVERHWAAWPLFWLSEALLAGVMLTLEAMGRPAPGWPLRITGEAPPGRTIQLPDVD